MIKSVDFETRTILDVIKDCKVEYKPNESKDMVKDLKVVIVVKIFNFLKVYLKWQITLLKHF
jgi:hypothetical protein